MSTKIYNGYKLKTNSKFSKILEVQHFSHKVRDVIKPIQERLFYQKFLSKMVDAYDKNQYGFWDESMYFIKNESSFYWGIDRYIHKRILIMDAKKERDPSFDFGFSYTILPIKNGNRVKILLLLYTEQKELREAFENIEEIEDYHYQNQTDRPKGISNKQWEKRRDDWDQAFGGDLWKSPAECGFTFDPTGNISLWTASDEDLKNMDQHIPSLEKRAKRRAHDIMLRESSEKNPVAPLPENATKEQKEERYRDGMEQYWAFDKYLNSDDGQNELNAKTEAIKLELRQFTYKELVTLKFDPHPNVLEVLNNPSKGGKPYWYEI